MKRRLLLSACLIFSIIIFSQAQEKCSPIVKHPVFSGTTKAIRDVPVIIPGPLHVIPQTPLNPTGFDRTGTDVIPEGKIQLQNKQDYHGARKMVNPVLNIEGIPNVQGYRAADPNGDIGIDYYIQTINTQFAVFDRQGNVVYGPVDYQSLFDAFPGPWSDISWCDPVIIYDHLADRWAFTTISFSVETYYEMVAVSVTSDPLGEYYCYAYEFDNLNDYPKMSMWPNGYYITYNIFVPGGIGTWSFSHALITAVDRQAMLNGEEEALMVQFEIHAPNAFSGRKDLQAADLNGNIMPVDEACWVVIPEYSMTGYPWPIFMNIFAFEPDWSNPANSSFDSITQFSVEGTFPIFATPEAPQPGNFHSVETMIFKLMYPLHYRNLGTYEVMAGCQTLYDGEQHYIRWYEFRKESDQWTIYQSGNYAPDSASRYDPSISVNGKGDIAMGFTKSSLEIYPSIWLTGRLVSDPLGEMTFGEMEIGKGLNYANNYNSNTGRNRWGDYASMMVDPIDDTTFWFTSMHTLKHTNNGNWTTRIVAFNLADFSDPYSFAGNDTVICQNNGLLLDGYADNYTSISWETSGDGMFLFAEELDAKYIIGNQDIENGSVQLCLNAYGYQPGSCCSDTMTLFINKRPEAEAGNDDTICMDLSHTLNGEVSFADHFYWTTNGSGYFNDSSLLNAIYTPAISDTALDYVSLRLHAEPMFPCQDDQTDSVKLVVESCVGITEPVTANFGLQVFPNPSSGTFTITAQFGKDCEAVVRIFDNSGARLFTGSYKTSEGRLSRQFDISQYPPGIYFVQVLDKKSSKTLRLVKNTE